MNILFVCTGNTCRSPMAAAIMEKLAYDDGLDIKVESAGLFANEADPITPNAVEALKSYDIDYSHHKAQVLTDDLIKKSDVIITMTTAHKMILADIAGDKTFSVGELSGTNEDIDDPFGGDIEDYQKTADKLFIALTHIENELSNILGDIKEDERKNS